MRSASAEASSPAVAESPAPACWPRVRMNAGLLAPWYTPILYRLRPVEVPVPSEVRIRSGWRLQVGDGLSEAELTALVIETCDHLEREHLERRGSRDPIAWMQAATAESVGAWRDLLAGEIGLKPGFVRPRFPAQAIHPEMFGLPPNRTAEEYYEYFQDAVEEALTLFGPYGPSAGSTRRHDEAAGRGLPGRGRRPDDAERGGDGSPLPDGPRRDHGGPGGGAPGPGGGAPAAASEPGQGQAQAVSAGAGASGGRGSFVNLAESELPADAGELAAVRRLVQHEIRHSPPGRLPGHLAREARAGVRATVPWQAELARLFGRTPGRLDYSLLPRPDYGRLLATGAIASRLQRGYPRTTVVRDTSASMDSRLLARVTAEIRRLTSLGVELEVADADTRVQAVAGRRDIDLSHAIGGGGTDMLSAAWEAWRLTRPECLVVLTDGETTWDEGSREPPNTIWLILNELDVYVPSRFRRVIRVREDTGPAG